MTNKMLRYILIFFTLLFFNIDCNDNSIESLAYLSVKPVVKVTSNNYDQITFRKTFPDTLSLNKISKAYSHSYSEQLRTSLIQYMESEIRRFGEDVVIFDSLMNITGCKTPGEYILPTYAEKTKYDSKDAWLIQFTYGLGKPVFGRWKCFAFSIPNLDTLAYIGTK